MFSGVLEEFVSSQFLGLKPFTFQLYNDGGKGEFSWDVCGGDV